MDVDTFTSIMVSSGASTEANCASSNGSRVDNSLPVTMYLQYLGPGVKDVNHGKAAVHGLGICMHFPEPCFLKEMKIGQPKFQYTVVVQTMASFNFSYQPTECVARDWT